MAQFKDGFKYSKSHEWIKVEGDIATIGLTDFAQEQLGDIVYAEAFPTGEEVELGGSIGSVESVKMATDVYAPVSGQIIESNESLEDSPEQINDSAFDVWFVKIKMANTDELNELMDVKAYEEFSKEEH